MMSDSSKLHEMGIIKIFTIRFRSLKNGIPAANVSQ
jgi:hypothetical protein